MSTETWQRWWHPGAVLNGTDANTAAAWLSLVVLLGLALGWGVTLALRAAGRMPDARWSELRARLLTWSVLIPALLLPLLAGALPFVLLVLLIAVGCYREFARATGLFRETLVSVVVVLATLVSFYAVLDHWYGLFVAMASIGTVCIAAASVLSDRPDGYIQRVALGVLAFLLFGFGLGHLAYFANDPGYRPIILAVILLVQLNDVFAYCSGRAFGKRKLCPQTSPNKTVAGAVGAALLTTAATTACFGWLLAPATAGGWLGVVGLGVVLTISGQLGDLVLSSIKRDLGVKDFARTLPGHGGLLDRFDSLVLAAPLAFHWIGYFNGHGIGLDEPTQVLTRWLTGSP